MMATFLSPNTVAKLKRMRWKSPTSLRSMHQGTRRSKTIGSSQEFSDYRTYEAGDDVRQIDWNVYARTEKVYIKRFLDERELTITILLDSSLSMWAYLEKWERAKQLTGALSALSLYAGDRLSLTISNHRIDQLLSKKGPHQVAKFLGQIENIVQHDTEEEPFSARVKEGHTPQSDVTIVISDGLETLSNIDETLTRIQSRRTHVYYVQLLHEEELSPPYTGDLKLLDIETRRISEVSMQRNVIAQYKTRLEEHVSAIESLCRKKGIPYVQVNTRHAIEEILFQQLKPLGWIN